MKKRLDQLVHDAGLAESRTKAQALIMAGQVLVDGRVSDKVGQQVDEEANIELKEKFPYVSRGALKLQKAVQEFGIDLAGKVVVDIGSSTGGFTDFALQNRAKKVFAVDVGRGQLDLKLREDPRVMVMEQTDFRNVSLCYSTSSFPTSQIKSKKLIGENQGLDSRLRGNDEQKCISDKVDIFVCDVSFISLKKIIPKIAELISLQCHLELVSGSNEIPKQVRNDKLEAILLIKPQFEVGKKEADRGRGVIRDEELRQSVVEEIKNFALENGFEVQGVVESPITGAKGNVEYLLWLMA